MKYHQLTSSRARQLRFRLQRVYSLFRGQYWFPHVPLALMLGLASYWILQAGFGTHWYLGLRTLTNGEFHLQLRKLPSLFIGSGMITMGLGLLWRSRLAWMIALLLAVTATVNVLLSKHVHEELLAAYFILIVFALLLGWRHFDRSSIAASTLFALTSIFMLLLYATFGAYYLGAEKEPSAG